MTGRPVLEEEEDQRGSQARAKAVTGSWRQSQRLQNGWAPVQDERERLGRSGPSVLDGGAHITTFNHMPLVGGERQVSQAAFVAMTGGLHRGGAGRAVGGCPPQHRRCFPDGGHSGRTAWDTRPRGTGPSKKAHAPLANPQAAHAIALGHWLHPRLAASACTDIVHGPRSEVAWGGGTQQRHSAAHTWSHPTRTTAPLECSGTRTPPNASASGTPCSAAHWLCAACAPPSLRPPFRTRGSGSGSAVRGMAAALGGRNRDGGKDISDGGRTAPAPGLAVLSHRLHRHSDARRQRPKHKGHDPSG